MHITGYGTGTTVVHTKGELVALKDKESSEVFVGYYDGNLLSVEYHYNPTDTLIGELIFSDDNPLEEFIIPLPKMDYIRNLSMFSNTFVISFPPNRWEILVLHADENHIIFEMV